MSNLVSELISYDGDILKFAGDAILTMWRVDGLLAMRAAVEHAIRCALAIQNRRGTYQTSVGVILKVSQRLVDDKNIYSLTVVVTLIDYKRTITKAGLHSSP